MSSIIWLLCECKLAVFRYRFFISKASVLIHFSNILPLNYWSCPTELVLNFPSALLVAVTLLLYRSAVHGAESVQHGLNTEAYAHKEIFCWLDGWSSLGLISAGSVCKQDSISAGRKLHTLFSPERAHVTASTTKGWGLEV